MADREHANMILWAGVSGVLLRGAHVPGDTCATGCSFSLVFENCIDCALDSKADEKAANSNGKRCIAPNPSRNVLAVEYVMKSSAIVCPPKLG